MFKYAELKILLESKTANEIAEDKGCGINTVYRYIKKFNLEKQKPMYQNKEWLSEQLINSSIEQIAINSNCDSHTISRWIKKFNLKKTTPLYQNKEWLIEQIKKFKNVKELATQYNLNEYTLKDWYRKYNLSFNISKDSQFKEDYFKIIDEEHKAYWLGFLTADGFMNKDLNNFGIGLKKEDEYILNSFLNDIQYNTNIHDSISGFGFEAKYITICSAKMCKDLVYLGIVPHKSGKEYIDLDHINKDVVKDFIRGYLDGDGWITINERTKNCSIGICSMSMNILYDIKYFLEEELNINCSVVKRKNKNKLYDLNIHSTNAAKFLDYIYKDSTIYLDRKYKKYDNVTNLPLYIKYRKNLAN